MAEGKSSLVQGNYLAFTSLSAFLLGTLLHPRWQAAAWDARSTLPSHHIGSTAVCIWRSGLQVLGFAFPS